MTDHQLVIDSDVPDSDAQSSSQVKIGSISFVESTLLRPVTITPRTKLANSSFKGTTGLEMLRFQSNPEWLSDKWGRSIIFDATPKAKPFPCSSRELEDLYRQLRTGMEESKAGPAAGDFFYGEMEARREHTYCQGKNAHLNRFFENTATGRWLRHRLSLRWWQLSLYKWCAGYGVRPWRAFVWYMGTVIAIAALFSVCSEHLVFTAGTCQDDAPNVDWFESAFAFSLRNSVNLFRAPDTCIQPLGIVILVIGRLSCVAFLALAILGLRSHVER